MTEKPVNQPRTGQNSNNAMLTIPRMVILRGREAVSHQAHNLKLAGSIPAPATNFIYRELIMAGVIEKNAKTPFTILQQPVIADGKTVFQQEVPALGMIFDWTKREFDLYGSIQNGKKILAAPLVVHPVLPGRVVFDGIEYEAKEIKIIRNLRGKLLGYKIIVAGV